MAVIFFTDSICKYRTFLCVFDDITKSIYTMKFLSVFAACLGMMVAASCAQTEKKQVTENQVIETIMARRSIRKYKQAMEMPPTRSSTW